MTKEVQSWQDMRGLTEGPPPIDPGVIKAAWTPQSRQEQAPPVTEAEQQRQLNRALVDSGSASATVRVADTPQKTKELVRSDDHDQSVTNGTSDRSMNSLSSVTDSGTYDKRTGQAMDHMVHEGSGVVLEKQSLTRSEDQLRNTRAILLDATTSEQDKLRAAGVLAANGETSIKGTAGQEYNFSRAADGTVSLSYKDTAGAQVKTVSAKIGDDARLVQPDGAPMPTDRNGQRNGKPAEGEQPPKKPEDKLFDPTLSAEEKLKAASELAHNGQRRFKGPDGKSYEISTAKYGDRESVVVHVNDGHGHTRPVLRGMIEKDGHVSQQKDAKGRGVDYGGDWARQNMKDNPVLRHDEPKEQQKTDDGTDKSKEQGGDSQSQKDAREKLIKDAKEKITDETQQKAFLQHMDDFEKRAKEQNLPPTEVTETYKQLSRMLEASNAKVPESDRVLAAESFATHMADPKTIDQGNHNTCNVTTAGKREMFRNPSKMAEMVATATIDGEWTAGDGRKIKIDERSLVPGREEREMPPVEPGRTYTGQLLNNVMANNILQRRMPPEYYCQDRVEGYGNDTGERVSLADKTVIRKNKPGIFSSDIQDETTRADGQDRTVLAHKSSDNSPNLNSFENKEQLADRLRDLKKDGKLPAVILVDANDPIFNGSGKPENGGKWHVVLIHDFDEQSGKVSMLNQWGRSNDKSVSVDDLYRSTLKTSAAVPARNAA